VSLFESLSVFPVLWWVRDGARVVGRGRVVRPVSNSFQVKEFVGKWFLPESVQHQLQALRLPDPACCRDPEREVSTDGLCV
jgi:hypothetical protein